MEAVCVRGKVPTGVRMATAVSKEGIWYTCNYHVDKTIYCEQLLSFKVSLTNCCLFEMEFV